MPLAADPDKPTVAMAFKIVEDPYGTLTFMRIYQGSFSKGGTYYNQRNGRKERFSRIVRMHADQREDLDSAAAGDIVAVLGVDAASGDTYASEYPYCTLQSMYVPEPVIKVAIAPANRDGADRLSKALQRFRREDPTLHIRWTKRLARRSWPAWASCTSKSTSSGSAASSTSRSKSAAPKVNYREAPTQAAEFNTRHKKQTGGSGPVRSHRRPARRAARGRRGAVRLRGRGDRRANPASSSFPQWKRASGSASHKGPVAGYPVVGPAGHARGRLVPRGGQLRHGVSDLCAGLPCARTLSGPSRCYWSR